MEELGFRVTHIYGMTELQGPSTLCVPQDAWADLPLEERAVFNARQGVRYPVVDGQIVADPKTLAPVARDGETIGEIMVRGNTVMLGYLKDPKATAAAFRGGWMHTGDLAVEHPDGYVEIKDRAKDIIISGGENISSVEVEIALYRHPAVQLAAVVAKPDEKWGETPVRVRAAQARNGGERGRDHRASAAISLRISRRRSRSCSDRCRRPRPARSRNSCCASAPAPRLARLAAEDIRLSQ